MKKLLVLLMMCFSFQSQALFEIRAGYGSNTLDEDAYLTSEFGKLKGFNLDAIIEPPLITDLGFGLRYETMEMELKGLGADVEMDRLSLLINYRVIDFLAYLGFIGTYALTNDMKYVAGSFSEDLDDKATYTIGVEGGVNLALFSLGVEVGKMFGEARQSSNGGTIELDGLYFKGILGIGF
ncbi:MAG: hypothetical protein K2Q26_07330 [Bdellovibrionales bacterium]|nr:hypothetical protein [Bdellovibrionales bacterium]